MGSEGVGSRKRRIVWTDSMLFNEKIPLFARVSVLVTILASMGVFAWSNNSVGASVLVKLYVGDDVVNLGNLFSFSLSNTVRDMWSAKVYPLAAMIAIFSGGWPYLKLFFMLLAWVLPRRVMSNRRRGVMLVWLDRLGKWSLIDSFVMVMFMVAFRLRVVVDVLVVDVLVNPEIGLYTFVLATMVSLILSHILLAYHRHTTTKYVVDPGGKAVALRNHPHRIGHAEPMAATSANGITHAALSSNLMVDDEKHNKEQVSTRMVPTASMGDTRSSKHHARVRCTVCGQMMVALLVLLAITLVIAGVLYHTFSFDFRGLTGLVLGSKAKSEYSLISLGHQLPASAPDPDSFEVHWLQYVFFTFALGMPIIYLLALLVLWLVPLTLQRQRMVLVLSEVSYAWAALEVFIVSILACVVEISQFAQFIVGDACTGLNKLLAVFFNGPLHGDDKCFDLIAEPLDGVWILLVSAVMLNLAGFLLGTANAEAVEDRVIDFNRAHERSNSAPGTPTASRFHRETRVTSQKMTGLAGHMDSDSESDDEEPDIGERMCGNRLDTCRRNCNLRIYRALAACRILELSMPNA